MAPCVVGGLAVSPGHNLIEFLHSLPTLYAQGILREYLQVCVKESIRLLTPFATDMLRVVPKGGVDGWSVVPRSWDTSRHRFICFHRSKRT